MALIIDFETRESRYVPSDSELNDCELDIQLLEAEIKRLREEYASIGERDDSNVVSFDRIGRRERNQREAVILAKLGVLTGQLSRLRDHYAEMLDVAGDDHIDTSHLPPEYW